MISKAVRKFFLLSLVFVILFISFLLMNLNLKEKELANLNNDEATSTEESIASDNEDATTTEENLDEVQALLAEDPRYLATEEALNRELPYPGLEGLGLEFMSEEEKDEFKIPFNREAQILSRDFEGNITSYKQIRQVEEVIYSN